MRIWLFHPRYLDQKGLSGQWLEAIMVKNIINRGRPHAVARIFQNAENPIMSLRAYQIPLYDEGRRRGYKFKSKHIGGLPTSDKIPITEQMLRDDFKEYLKRIKIRSPELYKDYKNLALPEPNPAFTVE